MLSLVEIDPVVLGGRYLNFVNVFSLFRNDLPLENDVALHLEKLESPPPKDALCQVWLKLNQWYWRRRFVNVVNVFSLLLNHPTMEKSVTLHSNKPKSPSPKDALRQI